MPLPRRICCWFQGADKGGWDVTQVLRVPGSTLERSSATYAFLRYGLLLSAENDVCNVAIAFYAMVAVVNPQKTKYTALHTGSYAMVAVVNPQKTYYAGVNVRILCWIDAAILRKCTNLVRSMVALMYQLGPALWRTNVPIGTALWWHRCTPRVRRRRGIMSFTCAVVNERVTLWIPTHLGGVVNITC